jgi:hypothetical protein
VTKPWKRWTLPVVVAAAALAGTAVGAATSTDFGATTEARLEQSSGSLFGVGKALAHSSTLAVDESTANDDPTTLVTLAKGLKADVVSAGNAAPNIDMIALWPNDTRPTHLIACNEQGTTDPGVQRIDLRTGDAETIVTGTSSCDPTHVTPWGTS